MESKRKKSRTRLADCGGLLLLLPAGGGRRGDISRHGQRKSRGRRDLAEGTACDSGTEQNNRDCAGGAAGGSRENKGNKGSEGSKGNKSTACKEKRQPVFAAPLEGETKVVLAYSTDHAIYDPTLEQYRTNASVSLSAKKGTEVKAAADGVVKEVKKDAQAGNLVRIAHGEDWLTTYGQLADAVAVKEGESVKQGQRIGTVAAPTKYGVALGEHLIFAMEERRTAEPDGENENRRMKTEQAEFGVRLVFL